MLSLRNSEVIFQGKKTIPTQEINDNKDCFICKVMEIKNDKTDIVKWIFSSKKSPAEKAKLASLLTGIEFDEEIISCILDPNIKRFLFSE